MIVSLPTNTKKTLSERYREFVSPIMGDNMVDDNLSPLKWRPEMTAPVISAPPFQLHSSPSLTRSPLLDSVVPKTPKSPWIMTPLASPMKRAFSTMQGYLEEVGHLTKLNPQEEWLPITESRKGNAYYAAFHTLSSGIGFQALVLPLAFTALGGW